MEPPPNPGRFTLHAHIVCPSCHGLREASLDRSHLRQALHQERLGRVDVVIHRLCPDCA